MTNLPLSNTPNDVISQGIVPFGEIVESSLTQWVVHCWKWDEFPPFGSLLTVGEDNRTTFGLVVNIRTGSNDPSRTPYPYQKTHVELKREHPHVFALLQTTITAVTIGYQGKEDIIYQRAPYPPKIHAFVQPASIDATHLFFSNPAFISLLCTTDDFSREELLLAILTHLKQNGILERNYLHQIVAQFSLAQAGDYKQLKLFLQRVQALYK